MASKMSWDIKRKENDSSIQYVYTPEYKSCKARADLFQTQIPQTWFKAPYKYNLRVRISKKEEEMSKPHKPFVCKMTLLYEDGSAEVVHEIHTKSKSKTKRENYQKVDTITNNTAIMLQSCKYSPSYEAIIGPFQFNVCSYKKEGKKFRIQIIIGTFIDQEKYENFNPSLMSKTSTLDASTMFIAGTSRQDQDGFSTKLLEVDHKIMSCDHQPVLSSHDMAYYSQRHGMDVDVILTSPAITIRAKKKYANKQHLITSEKMNETHITPTQMTMSVSKVVFPPEKNRKHHQWHSIKPNLNLNTDPYNAMTLQTKRQVMNMSSPDNSLKHQRPHGLIDPTPSKKPFELTGLSLPQFLSLMRNPESLSNSSSSFQGNISPNTLQYLLVQPNYIQNSPHQPSPPMFTSPSGFNVLSSGTSSSNLPFVSSSLISEPIVVSQPLESFTPTKFSNSPPKLKPGEPIRQTPPSSPSS